ncbi:MAG: DUF2023 family protein [Sphaerochaetaceae bacterium]|nr:DUF2023 family protein [Sphaerochaetaceae bacterium]MDC7248091.1 DUF2023 family protein [Sphaerochaetaceae bacterium]
MRVFAHHLYEYRKGLRRLILHTTRSEYAGLIVEKCEARDISYIISEVNDKKINVFFGDSDCIDVLKSFDHLNLCEFTVEMDFILGSMLGYDVKENCRRFLERSSMKKGNELKLIS